MYFWINDEYAVFASALRILEDVDLIPKRLNVRAVTEIVGLGYALGERTPYADICMVRAAEVITIGEQEVSRQKYWHWDEIEPSTASEDELLAELYSRFNKAVARRLRNDRATAAYLSGGLDSRCIVAALRDKNAQVHTFNFAAAKYSGSGFWFGICAGSRSGSRRNTKETRGHGAGLFCTYG